MSATWSEEYSGGSPEAERLEFAELAKEILLVQRKNQKSASAHKVRSIAAETYWSRGAMRWGDTLAVQAHHVETGYYERFFQHSLTEAHLSHDHAWHANE